jgi:hydroxyethylthiazole kinase
MRQAKGRSGGIEAGAAATATIGPRSADQQKPIDWCAMTAEVIARVRARTPRVHCVTNTVAQAYTANILLAAGAVPSMTIVADEIGAFVAGADALLVNLGTLDGPRREAIAIAVQVAGGRGVPWVLDPAFVDRSPTRAAFARALLSRAPQAVRLNSAEFAALAGATGNDALAGFARAHGTVVGLTGATDIVGDAARLAAIANGHGLMHRVTAMGCAASALVAACLAVEGDAWQATVAALLAFGVAGEIAAETAKGPGTFAVAMIDAIDALDHDALVARARVDGTNA